VLDEVVQKRYVLRRVEQSDEAAVCAEKIRCGFTDRHGGSAGWRFSELKLLPAQQLAEHWHIELQRYCETWHFLAGVYYLADDWQVGRGQQVTRFAVDESGSSEFHPL